MRLRPIGTSVAGSYAANEVWSYRNDTQKKLENYTRLRATLKPYKKELAENVTATGAPTARPLWWASLNDAIAVAGIDTQFMLGSDYLVAPITVQNATSRSVYFPGTKDVKWYQVFDRSVMTGGQSIMVDAPLEIIQVYTTKSNHRL